MYIAFFLFFLFYVCDAYTSTKQTCTCVNVHAKVNAFFVKKKKKTVTPSDPM